jgi:hypothetical protein
MNLIEPCILGGAVVGAVAGTVLGFSESPLWGMGGLVAGGVLGGISGPFVAILLGMLFVTVARGPRFTLRLLREILGPRRPPNPE